MAGQKYLIPIKDYQFDLKSEKINSIARLVKLGLPTVPFPHVLLPQCFEFYLTNKSLPEEAEQSIQVFFKKLKKVGYTATARPSIFADIPGAEFLVKNRLNLPTYQEVIEAVTVGYDQIVKEFKQPGEIEFAYLLQGFYTANKAGVVFSNDGAGHVYIEAAFGETTNIITRAGATPDIYQIDRSTGRITAKRIADKEFTLEASASGLQKVSLKLEERTKPVFTDQEIKKIYRYALRMEKEYGPQEIECAALRTGELIFQSTRNSKIEEQKITTTLSKNIPIFPQAVQGPAVYLRSLKSDQDLSQKIVITDNLDIDFITKLVYRFRPKGVVLIRGSLTAHAATILREARVPSVLANQLKPVRPRTAAIKTNGDVVLE